MNWLLAKVRISIDDDELCVADKADSGAEQTDAIMMILRWVSKSEADALR